MTHVKKLPYSRGMLGSKSWRDLAEQQRKLIETLSADREKLVGENQALRDALGGVLQAMQHGAPTTFPEAHSAVPPYGVPEAEPATFEELMSEAQRIMARKKATAQSSEAFAQAFAPGMEA